MLSGIQKIIEDLQLAKTWSIDTPDVPHIPLTQLIHMGQYGYLRVEIDPNILAILIQLWGPTVLEHLHEQFAAVLLSMALSNLGILSMWTLWIMMETPQESIHCQQDLNLSWLMISLIKSCPRFSMHSQHSFNTWLMVTFTILPTKILWSQ